jgi:hypothetical protein
VARIERDHVFPPRFERDVGHAWKDDVPRLRDEFVRATDPTQALVALRHLQNSLRDAHCHLDPPSGAHARHLVLGVHLWSGGTAAAPDVRVDGVEDAAHQGDVRAGDEVVSVDGRPVAAWIADHPFESPWLAPSRHLEDTIQSITVARLPWSDVRDGDARVLGIRRDGQTRDVTFHFRSHFQQEQPPDLDHPPPLDELDCSWRDRPAYGDYGLAAMGVNVCVYQPTRRTRPRVPVVRYVSFYYPSDDPSQSLRMVKVDHDVLARELRGADGVVLDVHENGGGNNPFVFLRWFSGGPWNHERVVTRVLPELDRPSVDELLWGDEKAVGDYAAAQTAGQPTIVSRFLCSAGACDGDTGSPAELVTHAPVALLVGPECVSSCDTFALEWSAFHLGRLVGQQPAHAYTVHRLELHVTGPESEDLGTLRVALSESELVEGKSIEGEPLALDWEAPTTFETRESWVRSATAEAVKRMKSR